MIKIENFKIGDKVIITSLHDIAASDGYEENKEYKIVKFHNGNPMLESSNGCKYDLLLITENELQFIELAK